MGQKRFAYAKHTAYGHPTAFRSTHAHAFFGTKYTLTDSQLHVDSGLSTQKIELTDITYITPTRSMSSAPALSLDRLKIAYRNQEILISPKDKSRFYQEIQARNPKIVIDEVSE